MMCPRNFSYGRKAQLASASHTFAVALALIG